MSKTLPALTAAAALDGTEQVLVSQGGNPRRSTSGAVVNLPPSGGAAFALNLLGFIPQSEWAGIVAHTSSYDCSTAMAAAVAALPAVGGVISIPPGLYNFSATVHLKKCIHLRGAGAGQANGQVSWLKWPAAMDGIVVDTFNTHLTGGTGGGDASILEGLYVLGGGTSGNGITLHARASIRECVVGGFAGNGIHIVASVGGVDADGTLGNANNWHIDRCWVDFNAAHGLFIDGTDANAGNAIGLSASNNGGWGVFDSSFLGNTFTGCHTETNTLGGYKTDNVNARSIFVGCYSEGGQPPSNVAAPSLVIGGLHAAGYDPSMTGRLISPSGASDSPFNVQDLTNASVTTIGYLNTGVTVGNVADSGSMNVLRWDPDTKTWADTYVNSGENAISVIRVTKTTTGFTDGSGTKLPDGAFVFPNGFWVPDGAGNYKLITAAKLAAL